MSIFYIAAHALILNENNKVLTLRRSEVNDYKPLYWDIPGGTVDVGETVENALEREIKEETSLIIKPIKPIYVYSNLDQVPKRQTAQIIYLCKYISGEVVLNPEEHDEFKWVDYNELKNHKNISFLEALIRNYNLDD